MEKKREAKVFGLGRNLHEIQDSLDRRKGRVFGILAETKMLNLEKFIDCLDHAEYLLRQLRKEVASEALALEKEIKSSA